MASNDRQAREERARLRTYQARQEVHASKQRRRSRDNVIAVVSLVVVLALAIGVQLLYFSGGPGTPEPVASETPTPTPSAPAGENQGDVPSADIAEGRAWTGTLTLNDIPVGVELDGAAAPQAVSSEISLIQSGFYDGTSCHRLTTEGIWVLQCGDPAGDGTGGPGYSYGPVENAPADGLYPAGTIAMARARDPVQPGQPVLHRLRGHDAADRHRRVHRDRARHERPRRAARRRDRCRNGRRVDRRPARRARHDQRIHDRVTSPRPRQGVQ